MTLVSESKYQQANQSIMVKARDVFIMMSVHVALLIAQLWPEILKHFICYLVSKLAQITSAI